MRVLVAPTAFKGTLGAGRVAEAMASGVRLSFPGARVHVRPLSDGGPGLLDALRGAAGPGIEEFDVAGPLGGVVRARILWTEPGEAVLESADACGLHLMAPSGRDPLRADTRGVGELVRRCLDRGARRVTIGLGGSGTVDGGTGLARGFGFRFLDGDGRDLPPGGGALEALERILPGRAPTARIVALADVRTPLCGPAGAARTFGPQKGADPRAVGRLEGGLERLATCIEADLGLRVAELPGGGAAGGLGAACAAFLSADLVPGADWTMARTGFHAEVAQADLVVTGEGTWDGGSGLGKIVGRVVDEALAAGARVLLACGRVSGPVPEGVVAVDAAGAELDEEGLADLVARSLRAAD